MKLFAANTRLGASPRLVKPPACGRVCALLSCLALLAPVLPGAPVSNAHPGPVILQPAPPARPPAEAPPAALTPDPDGAGGLPDLALDANIWEILFRWRKDWEGVPLKRRILIKHQEMFDWLNERIQKGDEYFMDPTRPAERQDSFFSAELIFSIDDNLGSVGADPSIDVSLALPNIENRIHLFFGNAEAMTLPGTDPRDAVGDPKIGLRGILQKTDFSFIKLNGGARLSGKPAAFTDLTLHYSVKGRGWNLGFENSGAYYTDQDGFSTMSQIGFMSKLSPGILFRLVTAGKWGEATRGVEFSEMAYLGYMIAGENDRQGAEAIGIRGVVFWHKNGPALMDNYRVKLEYRRRGFRKWLYYTLTPILEFPREYEFDPTVSFEAGVQIFFFNDDGLPF